MKLREVISKSCLMIAGALILFVGMSIGSISNGSVGYSASSKDGSSEEILLEKASIIDKIIIVQGNNTSIATNQASELSNLELSELQKLSDNNITVIIVDNNDVYEIIDPEQAIENKRNNIVTDAVYIPQTKEIIVSANAPNGTLTKHIVSI